MTALQHNSTAHNPNNLALSRVACYERIIRAPIVRVWENVLDWEHLPHLHATSFDYVALDSGGDWGWRTWSDPQQSGYVELCVTSDERYVARSYQGGQQITEIWTTLKSAHNHTAITVEFYIPDIDESAIDAVGDMMVSLYTTLWDEDESMMCARHQRLQEVRENNESVTLGREQVLIQRLNAGETITYQLKKREYQLRYLNDQWVTHATICPHLLGPLTNSDLSQGRLTCPWHGYQFDLATGECLSPAHGTCSLPANARLRVEDGEIIASAAAIQ
ncbi:MAG: nitrite reductase/ring-hydroxylating ferredoxin subunit [Bacteroidia bacterium]|jgi:nitrite reductase/ring-hydroxylating ferredoxin subunit